MFAALPGQQGSTQQAERSDHDEAILPEGQGEQADQAVGIQEDPGTAFKEKRMELGEKGIEIDRQVDQEEEDDSQGQKTSPREARQKSRFQPARKAQVVNKANRTRPASHQRRRPGPRL